MEGPTLTPVNFLTSTTASTVTDWFPMDYRYAGIAQRTVAGYRENSASDSILLELRLRAENSAGTTIEVIATATTWTGGSGPFSAVIWGAGDAIRIRKVGSSAAATVNGLV